MSEFVAAVSTRLFVYELLEFSQETFHKLRKLIALLYNVHFVGVLNDVGLYCPNLH